MPVFHKVQSGECLSTIGKQYRFEDFRTIFDHPKNGPLKRKRENPNVLLPGDCLFIPDKEQQTGDSSSAMGCWSCFGSKTRRKPRTKLPLQHSFGNDGRTDIPVRVHSALSSDRLIPM